MHLLTAKGAPRLQVCINAVELAIIANSIALDTVLKAACTRKSALQLITHLLFTFFFPLVETQVWLGDLRVVVFFGFSTSICLLIWTNCVLVQMSFRQLMLTEGSSLSATSTKFEEKKWGICGSSGWFVGCLAWCDLHHFWTRLSLYKLHSAAYAHTRTEP